MPKWILYVTLVISAFLVACEQKTTTSRPAAIPYVIVGGPVEAPAVPVGVKQTTIREILDRKMEYDRVRVKIEGIVWGRTDPPLPPSDDGDTPGPTTTGYRLRSLELDGRTSSPWIIDVLATPRGNPPINSQVIILGTVFVMDNGDPFIQQEMWPGQVEEGATRLASTPWGLIGAIAGAAALLCVLLFLLFRGRSGAVAGVAGFEGAWDRSSVDYPDAGGETIRLVRNDGPVATTFEPPPRTLRLAPGRFKIIGGDGAQDIRMFFPPGGGAARRTFGRGEGSDPLTHVQLRQRSVSREQAEALVDNGRCFLINRSGTNPTRLDNQELGLDERRELTDGARIEMGEVQLVFHSN